MGKRIKREVCNTSDFYDYAETYFITSTEPPLGKTKSKDDKKPVAKQMTLQFGKKAGKAKAAGDSQTTLREEEMETQETQVTEVTLAASTQIEIESTQPRQEEDDPIVEDQDQEVSICLNL